MLVLTRRMGEALLIGKNIRLVVLDVGRSAVRIAVEAPPEVPVHREEVALAIAAGAPPKAKPR